jgi:beta-N-acetylhexosaminidase
MNIRTWTTIILAGLASLLLAAAACDDGGEEEIPEEPSIRGAITNVVAGDDGVITSVLVEGKVEPDTVYDKASLRVDEDTEVFRQEGEERVEASRADLAKGQRVEAWIIGPVAESYPVQAYAGQVVILAD